MMINACLLKYFSKKSYSLVTQAIIDYCILYCIELLILTPWLYWKCIPIPSS